MTKPTEDVTAFLFDMIKQIENEDVDARQFRNGLDTIQDLIWMSATTCNRMVDDLNRNPNDSTALGSEYQKLIKYITYAQAYMAMTLPGQINTEFEEVDLLMEKADEMIEDIKEEVPAEVNRLDPNTKVADVNEHTESTDAVLNELTDAMKPPVSKNTRRVR